MSALSGGEMGVVFGVGGGEQIGRARGGGGKSGSKGSAREAEVRAAAWCSMGWFPSFLSL